MKVVLITNIPTPYRFPVYDRVSKANNFEFEVISALKLNLIENGS